MKVVIPLFGNELRIKFNRPLRWAEEKRWVPAIIMGPLVIAYWTRTIIEQDERMG